MVFVAFGAFMGLEDMNWIISLCFNSIQGGIVLGYKRMALHLEIPL